MLVMFNMRNRGLSSPLLSIDNDGLKKKVSRFGRIPLSADYRFKQRFKYQPIIYLYLSENLQRLFNISDAYIKLK